MVIYTGDTHGYTEKILTITDKLSLTESDTIVILGDAGYNYYGNEYGDLRKKKIIGRMSPTVFCIHGNHEMRPSTIPSYTTKEWNGGMVYYEKAFPNLLFAIDGEIYDLDGKRTIVIGGAYSVDKYYRIYRGINWFPDEQPSDEIKAKVEAVLDKEGWKIDQVLSHTCPYKYRPVEAFLSGLDQSTVDTSTEEWFDTIEDRLDYKEWKCGHWHIDKKIDRLTFLMDGFES